MENVSTRLLFENVFVASPESLQLKYSLAETADNMQNLTQIQIALNLAILPNKTMLLEIVFTFMFVFVTASVLYCIRPKFKLR